MSGNYNKNNNEAYDPSNLSKTTKNKSHQYLLIQRANSPPKKVENEVPGPPQLSPRMLSNAPGTPQDPAEIQGTPQEHSRAPRGRSQDPSRTPPIISQNASQRSRDPSRPRRPPGDPTRSLQGPQGTLPRSLQDPSQ